MSTNPPTGPKWGRVGVITVALLLLFAIIFAISQIFLVSKETPDTETVELSQILTEVKDGNAEMVTMDDSVLLVTLKRKDGTEISSNYPLGYANSLVTTVVDEGVSLEVTRPTNTRNIVVDLLISILPVTLLAGLLIWLVKSGAMGLRLKNGRGDQLEEKPEVTFSDVAGIDEAVDDLQEIVDFLKYPDRFKSLGAKVPKGALLVGPPGTGKTLLARAVAGEAQVPFFAVAGSDFVETYAGLGARRVRDLFDKANKAGRAIIFIDEIDAAGRKRSTTGMQGESERDSALISLLNEMDGFSESSIVVIAATNRPDMLDPALTRPGRLDRRIEVPPPDRRGREEILRVHTQGKPLAEDVNLESIAKQTPGMTGAELSRVVNEGALTAARNGSTSISQRDFLNALSTVTLGKARTSAIVTDRDREITAWHESGHATVALLLDNVENPETVTIIPRGQAGGATRLGGNDHQFMSLAEARDQVAVVMGGRAAEIILLGEDGYTQGAHSDLSVATNLATTMVSQYGMGERLAVLNEDSLRMGGEIAEGVQEEVERIIQEGLNRALHTLRTSPGSELLAAMAQALDEQETIDGSTVSGILDTVLATL